MRLAHHFPTAYLGDAYERMILNAARGDQSLFVSAAELIEAWRIVTSGINLQMAGAEKRQIGAHVEWIGILLLVGIGVVVVPRNKLIRARDALERARQGHCTYRRAAHRARCLPDRVLRDTSPTAARAAASCASLPRWQCGSV